MKKLPKNLTLKKTSIMASSPITSWKIKGEKVEAVMDALSLGYKITTASDCSHEIRRRLLLRRKAMTNLDGIKQRHHSVNKGPYSLSYGFSRSYIQMCESNHKEG